MKTPPNLLKRHEQYPKGFPLRINDALLGHWSTNRGVVVVENHPHGYEIHFYPCYDFDGCDACSPDRGTKNPHTDDGHDFRRCGNRSGPIVTVAGGETGRRAVLQYLAIEESPPHVLEYSKLVEADKNEERERLEREQEEGDALRLQEEAFRPSPQERLAALEVEFAAIREEIRRTQS